MATGATGAGSVGGVFGETAGVGFPGRGETGWTAGVGWPPCPSFATPAPQGEREGDEGLGLAVDVGAVVALDVLGQHAPEHSRDRVQPTRLRRITTQIV